MAPLPKSTNHHPPTPTTMNYFSDNDYPHELSSILHGHKLTHIIRNPDVPSRTHRVCDVCRESIHGNFYHCKDCQFHVHSFCTRLPNNLRHVIDPHHKLLLYKRSYGHCSICKADCSAVWVYGCSFCEVNIHLNCLRKLAVQPTSGSRGMHHHHAPPPWATGLPPQQHFHGWRYPNYNNQVQFGYHYNNNHNGNSSSSSTFGSVVGSTMFSLVESLAIGALSNIIFGSVGF